MAEPADSPEEPEANPRRGMGAKGWIATLVAALALGGGGFYVTWSGLADDLLRPSEVAANHGTPAADAPSFLELDPLMVTVGGQGSIRQLRFRAFLQTEGERMDVAALQPRILDIFATYLRAVPVDRLEDPTALVTLRAQLLRRVQLLAGPEAVRDLLIIDFVIT
ncbi:flagellar basal body-associated FliL family protein [Jannaschia rubra]|uniref:flagellar basal body-associated FliL family protein n=1 Tax=Jannaschia rubra TaxID=282197 RepID=UPI00249020E6|nr:flagellar basal body-associated FliL family protein [Jannaschia rubra]